MCGGGGGGGGAALFSKKKQKEKKRRNQLYRKTKLVSVVPGTNFPPGAPPGEVLSIWPVTSKPFRFRLEIFRSLKIRECDQVQPFFTRCSSSTAFYCILLTKCLAGLLLLKRKLSPVSQSTLCLYSLLSVIRDT